MTIDKEKTNERVKNTTRNRNHFERLAHTFALLLPLPREIFTEHSKRNAKVHHILPSTINGEGH